MLRPRQPPRLAMLQCSQCDLKGDPVSKTTGAPGPPSWEPELKPMSAGGFVPVLIFVFSVEVG